MATALIGLGSNIGDRAALLEQAIGSLAAAAGCRLKARSTLHSTPPVGGPPGQGDYLNAVALLETASGPELLFAHLVAIEQELGRVRGARWAARTIDLDLLLYDDLLLDTPALQIPHPRLICRRFVLEPAVEIAPEMREPASHWTLRRILAHLNTGPDYVALAGGSAVSRRRLALQASPLVRAQLITDVAGENAAGDTAEDRDRAGRVAAAELELLRRRAILLDAAQFLRQRPDDLSLLSDFWFDAPASWVGARSEEAAAAALWREWLTLRSHVLPAKLVVVLQRAGSASDAAPAPAGGEETTSAQAAAQTKQLSRFARQLDDCLVLPLVLDDEQQALRELVGAMLAMRRPEN